ncbi:MAG: tetratricopeptide repeat protein [Deltaproteobacteria bacterium]|nr:tetratricopeptide repeat protein [Deltaproteobacteria bacterium]
MPDRYAARAHGLALVVIATATTLAYAGSFGGTWISDDVTAIFQNTTLRALTSENLRILVTSRTDGTNYIPLNFLSLALDYRLWGPDPRGFHLTNLLLHLANAAAVYWAVARLHGSRGLATAAALLWSLHPVQVESVAWISERKNLLSTLFFLLAFHMHLGLTDRPTSGRYLGLVTLYVAALLSKVNTIVLPALLLWYEIVIRRRLRAGDLARALPLLACGAVVAWANLHDNPSHGAAYHGGSLAVTMRTSVTTIPRYLWNVVAPFDLMAYYPVPLRASWLDPTVVTAVAVIGALMLVTCWCAARGYAEGFWLVWFGVTLSPMLNLVPFPALMNDRYLYLPLLGALVPLLRLGQRALASVGAARGAPFAVGAAAVVLALLTTARVAVFHDPLSLWADMGLRTPYITADQPYGPGPRTEEKRLLADALRSHPERAALHNNVGGLAFEENRLSDALASLTRAQELDPNDPAIALNLGRTQLRLGLTDDAIRTLERAVALEPPSFFARLNLARAYLSKGDLAAARAELTRAKTLKSDPYFWKGFEQALARAEQRGS